MFFPNEFRAFFLVRSHWASMLAPLQGQVSCRDLAAARNALLTQRAPPRSQKVTFANRSRCAGERDTFTFEAPEPAQVLWRHMGWPVG